MAGPPEPDVVSKSYYAKILYFHTLFKFLCLKPISCPIFLTGRGAGGKARKAVRLLDNAEYVIKEIDLHHVHMHRHNSACAWQEVVVLAQMSHPNIVRWVT